MRRSLSGGRDPDRPRSPVRGSGCVAGFAKLVVRIGCLWLYRDMERAMRSVETPSVSSPDGFEAFVATHERRLRQALTASFGIDRGREAAADALAYAWEHWDRVAAMANPAG